MVEYTPTHPHHGTPCHPDGSWKHTNALSRETSPYLLQHAHNPVDWHAWGPEAFALARQAGRPIFLSIGYSTCYWCHVMERQSFENPAIAALLNENFVCIKVDREERPDVDELYMTAVQLLSGHGGWPMSVFLTPPGAAGPADPGLRPFYAGTYIPPEPAHGLPGFPQVIAALAQAWKDQRAPVLEQAQQISQAVTQYLTQENTGGELGIALVQKAANQLLHAYDSDDGGFGGAPKFPQPGNLLFLIKVYQNNPHEQLWYALAYTLERMARGGMYDQIAGGFHRYSTDAHWLVPHFEKMLYDQAQLVETYLAAQAVQPHDGDPTLYPRIVRQTCDYVLREMTDPAGPFWSAQDAEVAALEGASYLWTKEQVAQALQTAPDLTPLALRLYGLDQGSNFQDPHHPEVGPANVLYVPEAFPVLAEYAHLPLEQLLAAKNRMDGLLLAARRQRQQPATDDKVLTAWNGLMIAGLARAGRDLGEPRYITAAEKVAHYILDHLRISDGGLYRTLRAGRAQIPGFLEDYAFLAHGLIALHRAANQPDWLQAAREITQQARRRFQAPAGGYFNTEAAPQDLFVRPRSTHDGALPNGNSQMIHNLLDLYELTQEEAYYEQAVVDLRSLAADLDQSGANMAHAQHALLRALEIDPRRCTAAPAREPVTLAVAPQALDFTQGMARLQLTLHVHAPYHLNAHDVAVEGLVPTALALENAPGWELQIVYPAGRKKRFAFADHDLSVYEGTVDMVVLLKKGDGGIPQMVLHYQACTDTACLAPRTVVVPVTFDKTE